MTMKQADSAAITQVPVVLTLPGHKPMKCVRILRTGYFYDRPGHRVGFVQLLDKCGRSVVDANPKYVEVDLSVNGNDEEITRSDCIED